MTGFENTTGQRECVGGTIRGVKGRLIVWLNRWESETVEVLPAINACVSTYLFDDVTSRAAGGPRRPGRPEVRLEDTRRRFSGRRVGLAVSSAVLGWYLTRGPAWWEPGPSSD